MSKAPVQPKPSSDWCAVIGAVNQPPAPLNPTDSKSTVVMARFGAPHGLHGFLRLHIFSRDPSFFLDLPQWWCSPPATDADKMEWRLLAVQSWRKQQEHYYVQLEGIDDRDRAQRWCHGSVAVEKDWLPPTADDEYYWSDLIGLRVLGLDDAVLGRIVEMMDIGAHDVIKVRAADGTDFFIPFVGAYIKDVSVAEGYLRADWQADW